MWARRVLEWVGSTARRAVRTPSSRGAGTQSLALFVVALAACSGTDNAPDVGAALQPVLGGQTTEDCEWPAVVSLGECSGVLVNPSLVVYAAHCGNAVSEVRFGASAERPSLVVATDRCASVPNWSLGTGTDLAYCLLSEPVTEVEPARVLAGCELEELEAGAPVTMVGFGADGRDGEYGTQRVGSSVIAEVGPDLLLDSSGVDTCLGDSGGPLFLSREESDGTIVQRLVGITSAGTATECGSGVSHYVSLSAQIAWLEESSGFDVTPCFDGKTWAPTPDCVSLVGMTLESEGKTAKGGGARCRLRAAPAPLGTCGDPFAFDGKDETAPVLEVTSPADSKLERVLGPNEQYTEFEISANAKDDGWGVEEVRFSLLDADGTVKLERVDQIPPYGLPVLRLPEGRFTILTEAKDYAGNTAVQEVAIDVAPAESPEPRAVSSCQMLNRPTSTAPLLLLAVAGAVMRRRSSRR